jgi:spermidine/putrescine transport system permease protein
MRTGGGGKARRASATLVAPSALLLVAMVVVPLVALAYFSFVDSVYPLAGFSLRQYELLLSEPLYLRILLRTIVTATLVTLVTIIISWPAAWAMSRLSHRRQLLVITIVILPYLTSYLLLAYSLLVLIAPRGPLMTVLGTLHLASPGSSILYTPLATFVMLVYESIPIMLLVLFAGSMRITDPLLDAARSLGAGKLQLFATVLAPLSAASIAAGAALVFIPTLGVFAEPTILGGPNGIMFGNLINDQITLLGDQPFGAALSFVLLASVVLVAAGVWALGRLLRSGRERREARVSSRVIGEVAE